VPPGLRWGGWVSGSAVGDDDSTELSLARFWGFDHAWRTRLKCTLEVVWLLSVYRGPGCSTCLGRHFLEGRKAWSAPHTLISETGYAPLSIEICVWLLGRNRGNTWHAVLKAVAMKGASMRGLHAYPLSNTLSLRG